MKPQSKQIRKLVVKSKAKTMANESINSDEFRPGDRLRPENFQHDLLIPMGNPNFDLLQVDDELETMPGVWQAVVYFGELLKV